MLHTTFISALLALTLISPLQNRVAILPIEQKLPIPSVIILKNKPRFR